MILVLTLNKILQGVVFLNYFLATDILVMELGFNFTFPFSTYTFCSWPVKLAMQ
jgi:hypothetical protein